MITVEGLRTLSDDAMSDGLEDYGIALHDAADTIDRITRTPEPSLREALAAAWLAGSAEADMEWAAKVIQVCRDDEHYGDCTKAPITCNRCIVDEALEFANSALSASPAEPEVSEAMIEAVARALSPHMVRALAGCGSGAWDFPLLTDKERNRVKDAAADAITALRSAVQRGDGG